jgi:hypothetical protein
MVLKVEERNHKEEGKWLSHVHTYNTSRQEHITHIQVHIRTHTHIIHPFKHNTYMK